MQALLIANPTASQVTDASHRVAVRALQATFELEVVTTEGRHHAADLARQAVREGAKVVIVYGGDGTVNEVVNGLLGGGSSTDVTLGLLPGGGTNVLARTLGYPTGLVEATAHLLALVEQGRVRRLGLGRLRAQGPAGTLDRVFAFATGLGLDGEIVRRVERSGLRPRLGDLAFVYHGFRTYFSLRRLPRPPVLVDTPEGAVPVWWAIVCKSDPLTFVGSRPLRVCPLASHDRGLDLVAARTVRLGRTLRWLQQTLGSARHVRHPDCLYLPDLDRCSLRSTAPLACQTDGEYLAQVSSLEATVLPAALPVFA